ncbi:hypothetical protein, variant [Aphanomyces invadans]|nr:hypothetical protein, variant [Aphanomyces invadans]ETV91826.1 hypothetical protein, variant [Aphanomyces invadans]|eukprot:XP_008879463.1 hypothetical protein, variant [Aphanomyces invadans]
MAQYHRHRLPEVIAFNPDADPTRNFLDVATVHTFTDDEDAGATDVSTLEADHAPSLVEPSKSDDVPLECAVLSITTDARNFHVHCMSWTSIPADFARLDVSALASSPHVRGWVSSWCQREVDSSSASADVALVDFILRLVAHPETSHPDIMAKELSEFLSSRTNEFVVELWKVLVVALAVQQGCFQTLSDYDGFLESILTDRRPLDSTSAKPTAPPLPPSSARHADDPADKKRKRNDLPRKSASSRATPTQALRQVIANRMDELAQFHGWTVPKALTNDVDSKRNQGNTDRDAMQRRESIMALRNPLHVRDWGRKRRRTDSRDNDRRRRDHPSPDTRRQKRSASPHRHHRSR